MILTHRTTLLFALLLTTLSAAAQHVSREEALQRARDFMASQGRAVSDGVTNVRRNARGQKSDLLYVFNTTDGRGFVIVSGDDRSENSILGYCPDGGSYDPDHLNPNFQWWLEAMQEDIAQLDQPQKKAERRDPISPLVSTKWNQGAATEAGQWYNTLCPTIDGKHCITGCVATAMAQIMYYHKWPKKPTKEVPGYTLENQKVDTSEPLPPVSFDWKNMALTYNTSSTTYQINAVSTLMRYCGQAAEMEYGLGASAASTWTGAKNMVECFDYNPYTWACIVREDWSKDDWEYLMYSELKQNRPVLYAGGNTREGHAFVLDGYNNEGLWHFNWGWGGYQDGYYSMTSANGYSSQQDAVIGLQPSPAEAVTPANIEVSNVKFVPSLTTTLNFTVTNTGGMTSRDCYEFYLFNWRTGGPYQYYRTGLVELQPGESQTLDYSVLTDGVGANHQLFVYRMPLLGFGEGSDIIVKYFDVEDICNLQFGQMDITPEPTTQLAATVNNLGTGAFEGKFKLVLQQQNPSTGTFVPYANNEVSPAKDDVGPYIITHQYEGLNIGNQYKLDLYEVSTKGEENLLHSETFTVHNYIRTITYVVDGEVYKSVEVEQGTTVVPEANPVKPGYEFSGWEGLPDVMPDHDITVTGYFTKIPEQIDLVMSDAGYATFYDSLHDFQLPSGLTAYVATDITNGRISYTQLNSDIIPAGVAVVVKSAEKKAATYTLVEDFAGGATYVGSNLLRGSDNPTLTTANVTSLYYKLAYGPKFTYMEKSFGWYWGKANGAAFTIEAHRAWLALPRTAKLSSMLISLPDNDADECITPDNKSNEQAYDLQGRPVRSTSQPGIYIVGGKKQVRR